MQKNYYCNAFIFLGVTMKSINYNFRMDEELRDLAFPVIESYGLTPPQAIKLFLKQIADTKTIPLTFNHNAEKLGDNK